MKAAFAVHFSPARNVQNERDALVSRMKGRIVTIPDLKTVFHDWRGIKSRHASQWLEPLRDKVTHRLQTLSFDKPKQDRLEAADFALFTALWWPDAPSLAHLEILAYLVIWLFTWDDEIDEPTGTFTDDVEGADTYRADTLRFVAACLELPTVDVSEQRQHVEPKSGIVRSFDVIGAALRCSYDKTQRQRFFDEIKRFMVASQAEQACRLQYLLFTLDQYWSVRMGTSAVYIASAVCEYSLGGDTALPLEVMQSSAMLSLWDETNMIISITNDLLSLRKEMQLGCIDSVVPLTFALRNDAQLALDESVAALRTAKERLDEAAQMLLMNASSLDTPTRERIGHFIEVHRSNCIGNLVWSLETRRYNSTNILAEDGSQTFAL